jgi:hypothetical protein
LQDVPQSLFTVHAIPQLGSVVVPPPLLLLVQSWQIACGLEGSMSNASSGEGPSSAGTHPAMATAVTTPAARRSAGRTASMLLCVDTGGIILATSVESSRRARRRWTK